MSDGTVAAEQLLSYIERWERLEVERKAIAEDQKNVLDEAKSEGYDVKAIRRILAIRKRDKDDIEAEEAIVDLYKSALGME